MKTECCICLDNGVTNHATKFALVKSLSHGARHNLVYYAYFAYCNTCFELTQQHDNSKTPHLVVFTEVTREEYEVHQVIES
jgi:hypothetical protein